MKRTLPVFLFCVALILGFVILLFVSKIESELDSFQNNNVNRQEEVVPLIANKNQSLIEPVTETIFQNEEILSIENCNFKSTKRSDFVEAQFDRLLNKKFTFEQAIIIGLESGMSLNDILYFDFNSQKQGLSSRASSILASKETKENRLDERTGNYFELFLLNLNFERLRSSMNAGYINADSTVQGVNILHYFLIRAGNHATVEQLREFMSLGFSASVNDVLLATKLNFSQEKLDALMMNFDSRVDIAWIENGKLTSLVDEALKSFDFELMQYWLTMGGSLANKSTFVPIYDQIDIPMTDVQIDGLNKIVTYLLEQNIYPKTNSSIERLVPFLDEDLAAAFKTHMRLILSAEQAEIERLSRLLNCPFYQNEFTDELLKRLELAQHNMLHSIEARTFKKNEIKKQLQEERKNTITPEQQALFDNRRFYRHKLRELAKEKLWDEFIESTYDTSEILSRKDRQNIALERSICNGPMTLIRQLVKQGAVFENAKFGMQMSINCNRADVLNEFLQMRVFDIHWEMAGHINGIYYGVENGVSFPTLKVLMDFGAETYHRVTGDDLLMLAIKSYFEHRVFFKVHDLTWFINHLLANLFVVDDSHKNYLAIKEKEEDQRYKMRHLRRYCKRLFL